jgi:hypothetical protein
MNIKAIFSLVLLILITTPSLAENTETVVVDGIGDSFDSATADAGKAAVNEVVGFYTTSEIRTINEELIDSQILTYSNGYLKSLKIIDQSIDKSLGGLYRVKAKAIVIVDKLTQKLEDENITTVSDPEFISKVIGVFTNTDIFRKIFKKEILSPIFNDESAYKLEYQGGLEPYIDDRFSGLKDDMRIYHFSSKEDKEKYGNLEIIPFYFNFKVSLNDEYLERTKKLYNYLANGDRVENTCASTSNLPTSCCSESSVCIVELKDPPTSENWFIGATATEYNFSSINNRIVNSEFEKIKNLHSVSRHSGAYFNFEFLDKDENIIGSVVLGGEGAKPIEDSKYSSTSIITPYGNWGDPWHKNLAPMVSGFYINKKALIDNNQSFVVIVLLDEEEAIKIKKVRFTIDWLKPSVNTKNLTNKKSI